MSRSRPVTAKVYIEIEIEVAGLYLPGTPPQPPAYAHGGLPGDPDELADLMITGIHADRRGERIDLVGNAYSQPHPFAAFRDHLLEFVKDQAIEALFEAAEK